MGVQLLNHQALPCFKISHKVQLTYKLFLLENARNVLIKQLDNLTNKAYEEVQVFLHSSIPTNTFMEISESLDLKCNSIKQLSDVLRNLKFASLQEADTQNAKSPQNKPKEERSAMKCGPTLQNIFMPSSIGKAFKVLGACLRFQHLKHLVVPQKYACRDDKVNLNQTATSDVQEKDASCRSSSSQNITEQDGAGLGKTEQNNLVKCSSIQEVQPFASGRIVITNPHQLLLPPIPEIPGTNAKRPYLGIPMTKWGREDDIQLQHQKQTSSQLLHFLKVKAKTTGGLNVTVMEWFNSVSGLPPPLSSPAKNITKQANQFKQDGAWPPGMLSEIENHTPLFKVKGVDSGGSLTYTCVIATKTELWDMGDVVTDLKSEGGSVSSEESAQAMPFDESLKCRDATVQKKEVVNAKMYTQNVITIPEFQNKRFEEIEVVMSHIVNPSNFYIQHKDANEKLQTLLSDAWKEKSTLAEKYCIPDIGTKVMGWFPKQRQWCRSQVTKICGISEDDLSYSPKEMSIHLEVKRLDYGDSSCLSLWNIKEMTSEMAVLPLQAVQVSLAHVSPVNGRDWSDEALSWFRHMVNKRILYARLYPEGHRILVDLFLEKGKIQAMRRGASLSLRLTQNGHAKLKNGARTEQRKMKKKDLEWEKHLISCYIQNNLHRAVL